MAIETSPGTPPNGAPPKFIHQDVSKLGIASALLKAGTSRSRVETRAATTIRSHLSLQSLQRVANALLRDSGYFPFLFEDPPS
jgi:hypothetical protein